MSISNRLIRARCLIARLRKDSNGLAAVEFAMVVPLMLVMFFGTAEICSLVAVSRKVTLVSRTLSDLTSQYSGTTAMSDTDLQNTFAASYGIITPYDVTQIKASITEVYVNSSNIAKVQWSKKGTVSQSGSTVSVVLSASSYTQGQSITIPPGLLVANTYLILSEVTYTYVPTVAWFLAATGKDTTDKTYTRPRQLVCIPYPTTGCTTY